MLRCLHITHLAIVRELTLDLGPGLNLLTGETGAGKSILVDALSLVLGGRSGAEMIRSGAERASVEAEFDVSSNRAARQCLEERGYRVDDGTVVVRREVLAQGKGRAFLGGSLASVADLRALGSILVDLHGQHQQQSLLTPANHRDLLDRHAGLDRDLDDMAAVSRRLEAATERLAALREGADRRAARVDLLRSLAEEIDRAAVQPGERSRLRAERDLLRNAEAILRHARQSYDALYEGEGAALSRLAEAIRDLRDLARFDPALQDHLTRAESARADLQDIAIMLRDYPARLQFEPHRLQAIDDRIQALETLLRRHAPGGDEDDLLRLAGEAKAELGELTGGGETPEQLERIVQDLRAEALRHAASLSRARSAAARVLEREVEKELAGLAMARSRFAIEIGRRLAPGSRRPEGDEQVAVDATGYDVVEFRLSANPGEPPGPLSEVASGGELSRVMLALEVVLRREAEPRSLVFDEVDAGIGGAVAEAVGRRLKSLSRQHQVICVTHLPQIASYADRHVKVGKRQARGRTEVEVDVLDDQGRVEELARMLAGEKVTPAALRHAAEMRARGHKPAGPEAGG
ncbi:MAG TPA: DNA repair protein RecN [Candidatus Polarisedimenticolia bacterium]|jgi:DNA repair protein RecN (Recombination protein N)|nr:DNA repair protein RecN [Candidatus Polarisedimenticolia bacterium]